MCEYCKYIDDQKVLEWNHAKQSEDDEEYYYDEIEPAFCPVCGSAISEPDPLTLDELRKMGGKPYWHKSLRGSGNEWRILDSIVAQCPDDYHYGEYWLAYTHEISVND